MMPPSLLVQVVGYPPITYTLCAIYALWLWSCYVHSNFLAGLVVFAAARQTLVAFGQRRRYKRYEADIALVRLHVQMQTGAFQMPSNEWGVGFTVFFIVMALMMMWFTSSCLQMVSPHYPRLIITLYAAWASSLLYLVWTAARLLLRLYRHLTHGKVDAVETPAEPATVHTVAWTLELPISSPSRAMVESELPDYCVGMMGRMDPNRS